jgi:hypothetical protein
LRGFALTNDILARVVVTTIAAIAFALLLIFDKPDIDWQPRGISTDLSASHR